LAAICTGIHLRLLLLLQMHRPLLLLHWLAVVSKD
jgi:hypothetical protein